MSSYEWALIIFTILGQMAVGSFLVLGIVHYFARRYRGEQAANTLSDRALLAIGPVLVLSLAASLFHLGTPAAAWRAVANVGSSWLSREVLLAVLFTAVGGVFAIMQWRKIATFALRNVIAWVAAVIGLALVYSMAQVYMLPNHPAWNSLVTPLGFYLTAVLLGSFAVGAAFVFNYNYVKRTDPDCEAEQCTLLHASLRWIAFTAVVAVGVQLVATPLYLATLSAGDAAMQEAARIMIGDFGVLLGLRLALVFLGAAVFGFFIYQIASAPGRERLLGNLALGAFALVLVAEVIGRYLFYATETGIGI